MTGLTEDINTQEEAIEYARNDPDKALGIAIWNLIQLKESCSCRLVACHADQRKSRLKNAAMQLAGGVVGGAVTVASIWIFIKDHVASLIDKQ